MNVSYGRGYNGTGYNSLTSLNGKRRFKRPDRFMRKRNQNFLRNYITLKVGSDMSGKHIEDYSSGGKDTNKVDSALSVAAEYVSPLNDYLELGAGVSYQFPREIEEIEGNFNFIPVYLLVKLRTSTKEISPYFLG